MTEHVHEWREIYEVLTPDGRRIKAWCVDYKECDGVLGEEEIMRRLNAASRLSAEDAREIAIETHSAWWPLEGESPYEDGLRSYAAALEGEND